MPESALKLHAQMCVTLTTAAAHKLNNLYVCKDDTRHLQVSSATTAIALYKKKEYIA